MHEIRFFVFCDVLFIENDAFSSTTYPKMSKYDNFVRNVRHVRKVHDIMQAVKF